MSGVVSREYTEIIGTSGASRALCKDEHRWMREGGEGGRGGREGDIGLLAQNQCLPWILIGKGYRGFHYFNGIS